jgi:O-antigen ligase
MFRYLLLTSFVAFLCVYAWKDWYRSLCGLIVLAAVSERYDMPRAMFGVVGLNPWNIGLLFIVLAWLASKRKEGLRWDLSPNLNALLIFYLVVIIVAVARAFLSSSPWAPSVQQEGVGLVIDSLVNSLKFVIPGLLLYHGCNSENRFWWGAASIMISTFLLSLQVIKWMPLGAIADGDALQKAALRLLDRNIGYHRVDLAAITASASWAFLLVATLIKQTSKRWLLYASGVICALALALTAGRAGYLAWLVIGITVGAIKYRRYLLVLPVLLVVVVMLVPAARERVLEGIIDQSGESQYYGGDNEIDFSAATSNRTLMWPSVIKKILEKPLVGYGRKGFKLSGARDDAYQIHGESIALFPHPHNAYLELLIDTGLVGSIPIFAFFFLVCSRSARMFKSHENTIVAAAGALALAFVLSQLVASIGSQSFYPRVGVVYMWCAIGLMLRIDSNYAKMRSTANTAKAGGL